MADDKLIINLYNQMELLDQKFYDNQLLKILE